MFQIRWSPIAMEEYEHHLMFWINHNKSNEYSIKIMQKVEEIEDLLILNPYIGKKTLKNKDVFRVLILRQFYIYYKIIDKMIYIIAFKGVAQGKTNLLGL